MSIIAQSGKQQAHATASSPRSSAPCISSPWTSSCILFVCAHMGGRRLGNPRGLLLLLPHLWLVMLLSQHRLWHAPKFKGLRQRTPFAISSKQGACQAFCAVLKKIRTLSWCKTNSIKRKTRDTDRALENQHWHFTQTVMLVWNLKKSNCPPSVLLRHRKFISSFK